MAGPEKPREVLLVGPPIEGWVREVMRSVVRHASTEKHWLFFPELGTSRKLASRLDEDTFDGVLSMLFSSELDDAVRRRGIPMVALAHEVEGYPSILLDDREIGAVGARYFLAGGYRHFAFCGLSLQTTASWAGWAMQWARHREEGFRKTLHTAGHSCSSYAYLPGAGDHLGQRRRLGEWLGSLAQPTGLMCVYDELARIVVEACRAVGLRVPEDLAVLGVDDDDLFTRLSVPPLSSVPLPWGRVARRAVDALDRMMRGRSVSVRPHRVKPTEPVVVRRSTDIVAIDDPDIADAVRYIHEHVADGPTVGDVVRAVGISRRNLELKFRRELARSPHQEIRRVQIRRIKELLVRTRWPMPRIAEAVGIRGARHMGTMFRAETGLTPDAFRRLSWGD